MYKKIVSTGLVLGALLAINGCGGGSSTGDSGNTGIQLAKDTIQELRTQALSLVDYNDSGTNGYLDTEAINIGSALENCSLDITTAADAAAFIIDSSINALNNGGEYLDGDINITCDIETNICTYNVIDTDYAGTVTLPDMDDSTNLGNFTTLHGEFDGTVPYGLGSTESQTFDLNITLTKTEVGANLLLTNISVEHNETSVGISDMNVSTAYIFNTDTNDTNLTWVKLNEVTLNGTCSDYTVVGKLSLPSYVQNAAIANENDGWVPDELIFDGSLTNTSTSGEIAGNITVNWLNADTLTTEDEPVIDIVINGSLAIPARPKMSLALTYNNDSLTEDTYHEFTSSYSYDDTQIDIEGILDQIGENGQITINANNGVKVLILTENGDIIEGNAEDSTGSIVTYNGSLIGTLEYLEGVIVIRYTDGSFESLP